MNSSIGFAIFGRPHGLEFISNGLFKEARLGNMMYLSGLTEGVTLQKDEDLAVIRQVTEEGRLTGITVVALFEYAESYGETNRDGGFLGSAVCFKGFPHPAILQDGVFAILKAAQVLIDPKTRKFLHSDKEHWNVRLPEPSEKWFKPSEAILRADFRKDSKLIIKIDRPTSFYLHGIVQGFLANPEFNGLEKCLVSSERRVLFEWQKENLKIISPYRLYDFSLVLGQLNNRLNDIRSKTEEKRKELQNLKNNIQEQNNNLDALAHEEKSLHHKISSLQKDLHDFEEENKRERKNLDNEKNKLKKQVTEEQERLEEIKRAQLQKFQDTVVNGPYQNELKKYVHDRVNPLQQQAKKEKEYREENYFIIEKRQARLALITFGAIVFTSLAIWAGLRVYQEFFVTETTRTPRNEKVTTTAKEKNQAEKKETPVQPEPIPAPKTLALNKIWELNPDELQNHQEEIRSYISQIELIEKYENDTASVHQFLMRKWHFAELLIIDEDRYSSWALLKRVESIYQKFGKKPDWTFSCKSCIKDLSFSKEIDDRVKTHLRGFYFLLPKGKSQKVKIESNDFGTIARVDILKKYLQKENNVYLQSKLQFNAQTPHSLLLQHFRWMVFHLSDHALDNQKDLFPTNQKTHNVPFYTEENDS